MTTPTIALQRRSTLALNAVGYQTSNFPDAGLPQCLGINLSLQRLTELERQIAYIYAYRHVQETLATINVRQA
jgi:hypothetical protein